MHIELLWLIPVLAFVLFIFIIAFHLQNRSYNRDHAPDLSKEVALFNSGRHVPHTRALPEDRIGELERTISSVEESLVHHQKSLDEIRKGSNLSANEVTELREKLRSILKEYDIILSENYSLRAKVKQLMKQVDEQPGRGNAPDAVDSILTRSSATEPAQMSMHLGDTRLFNLSSINEIIDDDNNGKK